MIGIRRIIRRIEKNDEIDNKRWEERNLDEIRNEKKLINIGVESEDKNNEGGIGMRSNKKLILDWLERDWMCYEKREEEIE